MRVVHLFAILSAAAVIAACSGGGGGPLLPTGLDQGSHEPSSDGQFFSAYEAPPGHNGGSPAVSTDQPGTDTTQTGGNGKRDSGGNTVVIEAGGGGFDAGGGFDSSVGTKDTGSTATGACANLQTCCDQLSSPSQKSTCQSYVDSGSQSQCTMAYDALVDAGTCG